MAVVSWPDLSCTQLTFRLTTTVLKNPNGINTNPVKYKCLYIAHDLLVSRLTAAVPDRLEWHQELQMILLPRPLEDGQDDLLLRRTEIANPYITAMPFGQCPILEVDGKVLAQSYTIARYLAQQHGLGGQDDWERAQADMYADCVNDLHIGKHIVSYLPI